MITFRRHPTSVSVSEMATKVSARLAVGILAASTATTGYLYYRSVTRGELLRCAIVTFGFWGSSLGASLFTANKLRRWLLGLGEVGTIAATVYAICDRPNLDEFLVNLVLLVGSAFMTAKMLRANPFGSTAVRR